MRNLAQRLVSEERRRSDPADTEARAAFRVCNKLSESLSALVGARGFRILLLRAQTLAKADAPWLGRLKAGANGALVFPEELERGLEPTAAAKGGAALLGHLLELLATFIGEALTLRLVQQVWPKVALDDSKSGGKT